MRLIAVVSGLVLLGGLGCGGGGGEDPGGSTGGSGGATGGGGTVAPAEAKGLCGEFCAHSRGCGFETKEDCEALCEARIGRVARADAFRQAVDCYTASCGEESLTACAAQLPVLPIHEELEKSCFDNATRCEIDRDIQADCDVPSEKELLLIAGDEFLNDWIACYEKPCPEIEDCINALEDALYGAHGAYDNPF